MGAVAAHCWYRRLYYRTRRTVGPRSRLLPNVINVLCPTVKAFTDRRKILRQIVKSPLNLTKTGIFVPKTRGTLQNRRHKHARTCRLLRQKRHIATAHAARSAKKRTRPVSVPYQNTRRAPTLPPHKPPLPRSCPKHHFPLFQSPTPKTKAPRGKNSLPQGKKSV